MGDLYEYARWKIKIIFCTYHCWVFPWLLADNTKSKNTIGWRLLSIVNCQGDWHVNRLKLFGILSHMEGRNVGLYSSGSQFLPYHTMALLKLCWNIVYRVFFFSADELYFYTILCYVMIDLTGMLLCQSALVPACGVWVFILTWRFLTPVLCCADCIVLNWLLLRYE